jgi:hypothetical protein
MARCTNCNSVLPFTKVAFLSKRKNAIECQKCRTVLEGDQKQLGIIGGISGGLGGLFGFLSVYAFLNKIDFAGWFLLSAITVVIILAMIQNQIVKLHVKDMQQKMTEVDS